MPNATSTRWTIDLTKRLKILRQSGVNPRQIADELGCSRNAVIGKLKRLGMCWPRVQRQIAVKPISDEAPPAKAETVKAVRKRKSTAEIEADKKQVLDHGHSKYSSGYRNLLAQARPQREMTKAELRAELMRAVQNTAAMQ